MLPIWRPVNLSKKGFRFSKEYSTRLFFKIGSNEKFVGVLTVCLKKQTPRNDKVISTCCLIEPGLTAYSVNSMMA